MWRHVRNIMWEERTRRPAGRTRYGGSDLLNTVPVSIVMTRLCKYYFTYTAINVARGTAARCCASMYLSPFAWPAAKFLLDQLRAAYLRDGTGRKQQKKKKKQRKKEKTENARVFSILRSKIAKVEQTRRLDERLSVL